MVEVQLLQEQGQRTVFSTKINGIEYLLPDYAMMKAGARVTIPTFIICPIGVFMTGKPWASLQPMLMVHPIV